MTRVENIHQTTEGGAVNKIRPLSAAASAIMIFGAGNALAQGYWANPASGATWKNGFGQCWKTTYFTPAMASAECDPDLVPKPAVPKPRAAAPKPAAKPAAKPDAKPVAKPAAKPPVLRSTVNFPNNGVKLDETSKFRLDQDVVAKLNAAGAIVYFNVEGHTDRLGSTQANQKLSEKRAEAVKAYLVSKGVDGSKLETFGYGQTRPVKSCPDQKDRKALSDCLAPNRRVDVEVGGSIKK